MTADSVRLSYTIHGSPIGELLLIGDEMLHGLYIPPHRWAPEIDHAWRRDASPFTTAITQLDAYFAGDLTNFDVPLMLAGTAFQRRVWAALEQIPYGHTTSYGTLAATLGQPLASRAVGAANGRNPVSIIVPCHRVIGASGTLTGYGAGVHRKRALLDHEHRRARRRPDRGARCPR